MRRIEASLTDVDGNEILRFVMEIEPEPDDCSCDKSGIHSLGSVASIQLGETDPACPHHGCG